MAFLDRSHIVRPTGRAPSAPGKELMAGILLVTLLGALGVRNLVSAEALAPAIVTLLFAVAAATAVIALLSQAERMRITWLDLAGSLTFIGVVISVLIEPDQLVRLCGISDQPE
ncbi:hypothetical protein [Bradyrhizobium australiense]|uniref:Uncharacterized protein n=1 Tax=Bradyrhizobium australiense TaxID=2721161 RepID=A0A7Y4GYE4_9BRAD|nr:hypothetical protein [Bradyrhizobium australiense]NOJ44255.1 hypothetical protein [Bradyrhizobium australiense]